MSASDTARGNGWVGVAPTIASAALFAWFLGFIPAVSAGAAPQFVFDWVPSLDISIAFVIDGLALTFALLISGIGTLVFLYSNSYLAGHPQFARFVLFLFSFMLAMLGLVLADDLIALFVFWELTTITSYLLIGFGHETAKGRRSALQALFVTGAGALAMLAGFILLGNAAGTFRISGVIAQADAVQAHPHYLGILILVLLGALTKSAQVPFHFWLPNAMAAPTPVSAFLHSATMVKGGVYLMARLHPALSGTEVWIWTLTILGASTAVLASLLAMRQTDLKQALAYTTLMALGTLTLFLGQDSAYAMTAFATFLVVHSLYKAALFLVVGCIDHETGTREVEVLGGLGRLMPVTALAAALAALSMAGLPPFIGYIGKELIYAGSIEAVSSPVLVTIAALAANALMVGVAGVVAIGPFWRKAGGPLPKTPHEAPWPMLAGPVILALAGTAFGVFPWLIQGTLIDPTAGTLIGDVEKVKELKLWAGINLPLYLSLATFALGFLLYGFARAVRAVLARADAATPTMDVWWDDFLKGLKGLAAWQTRVIQTGVLRQYMFVTFATVLVALVVTMVARGAELAVPDLAGVTLRNLALVLLIIAGAAVAAVTSDRITAMAALGVVGIGVAMIFIVFSAPDVAITQLMVETLVVVLVAVALLRLPRLDSAREDFRPVDAALAGGVGLAVTLVILAVVSTPLDRRLTDYFEATAYPEAFGRNIVNVILVDFRALDTFGEIAVVVIAALSAYALLRTTAPVARGGTPGSDSAAVDPATKPATKGDSE